MNKFALVEDDCLAKGKDFDAEKSALTDQGHTLVSQSSHPAIGRVAIFAQLEPDAATIADNELLIQLQG